jgi:hypothetical protein
MEHPPARPVTCEITTARPGPLYQAATGAKKGPRQPGTIQVTRVAYQSISTLDATTRQFAACPAIPLVATMPASGIDRQEIATEIRIALSISR